MTERPLVVVGNPASRRVGLLHAAATRIGMPPPQVLPWHTVLTAAQITFPDNALVRIESPGEDAEVDRLLRGADEPARHGEIGGGAAWYKGFCAALQIIAQAARTAGARLLGDPGDIAVMFDKRACHARLGAAGIPVPPALDGPHESWPQIRQALRDKGWHRAFLKPRHGSSASGVIALQWATNGRIQATTAIERADGRLFNSLRLRQYRRESDLAAIIERLAPDGLHIERWLPKADVDGHIMDMRVVLINGRPTHAVGRGSRTSPMTNLHLGGRRIDAARVRDAAGREVYEAAMHTCARVAEQFPRTTQMGVDLLYSVGFRRHAIGEVNAFGDLLPGLLCGGMDTYETQLRTMAVPA